MDGVHDMGGMHGFGAVVTPGSEASHIERWEVRAQMVGIMAGASSRAALERLDPAQYLAASYYARWLFAAENTVVKRSIVDEADLARWHTAFADDAALPMPVAHTSAVDLETERSRLATAPDFSPIAGALFGVGDTTRVRRQRPEHHHRCPRYVRGVVGKVERVVGNDQIPGTRLTDELTEPVYTVQFASRDLWGRTDEPDFELLIDLWQSYLEPV